MTVVSMINPIFLYRSLLPRTFFLLATYPMSDGRGNFIFIRDYSTLLPVDSLECVEFLSSYKPASLLTEGIGIDTDYQVLIHVRTYRWYCRYLYIVP